MWDSFKKVLAHNYFFWFIVGIFILQALWIANSALFPMLFDEQHHLGVIEIYSHQLSPFITQQPDSTLIHGDVIREPSYLYYYLMSFVYRAVTGLTGDFMLQVIALRIFNVAFVAIGLVVYRQVLKLGGVSSLLTNVVITFFTLIPLVPFVAVQINYDNLLFLVVALLFLTSLKAVNLKQNQFLWASLSLIIGLLGSLVKYSALPIFLAVAVLFAVVFYRQHNKKMFHALRRQASRLSKTAAALLVVATLVGGGLFFERYGGNLLFFGKIEPACEQLHSQALCQKNDVNRRNSELTKQFTTHPKPIKSPLFFLSILWAPHVINDFFVTGAYVGGQTALHKPLGRLQASPGSILLQITGYVVLVLGIGSMLLAWRCNKIRPLSLVFGLSITFYTLALLTKNYLDYTQYGQAVGTQGRYFIVLLVPIFTLIIYSLSRLINKHSIKTALLVFGLVIFTQGGGVMTYILYSQPSWYWPNQTIVQTNQTARDILSTFIWR